MSYVINLNSGISVRASFLNGGSPPTPPDPPTPPEPPTPDVDTDSITFLHISDIHEALSTDEEHDSLRECMKMMDNPYENIAFTVYTGDSDLDDTKVFDFENSDLGKLLKSFNTSDRDLLVVNGNHDIWGGTTNNVPTITQARLATSRLETIMGKKVNWGGELYNGQRTWSYWYKDYQLSEENNGPKLRIIGIDSYQCYRTIGSPINDGYTRYDVTYYSYDVVTNSAGTEIKVGNQIKWFADRLRELKAGDYLLIALHEPPVASFDTDLSYWKGEDETGKIKNSFYSDRLVGWGFAENNGDIWPRIINAYQKSQKITFTVPNKNRRHGSMAEATNWIDVVVDEDFTSVTAPCTFLGYLCGHIHADICCPHPNSSYNKDNTLGHSDQLIMCVDCSTNTNKGLYSSDILAGNRVNPLLINKVTINFKDKRIKIERIGNNQFTDSSGKKAIGTRKSITFDFNANIIEQDYGPAE